MLLMLVLLTHVAIVATGRYGTSPAPGVRAGIPGFVSSAQTHSGALNAFAAQSGWTGDYVVLSNELFANLRNDNGKERGSSSATRSPTSGSIM